MRRIRTASTALAITLTVGLTAAPIASANDFLDIYQAYATSGKIDPCAFSPDKIKNARKQVPGDIAQYAPDFPDALDAAAQARASGACDKKSSANKTGAVATTGATTAATAATTTAAAAPTTTAVAPATTTAIAPVITPTTQPTLPDATLASSGESGDDSTPVPLLLLAILGGLTLLLASTVGAVRYWAFDPPWMARTRHSVAEAGWRASAAWAEFTDWIRFGR
jgi:hypothetical protein